ncbi:MAG TPA: hypothetical protein VEL74_15215 [Thermoanaerobaculia bacterium]|nr:hypothetical protein [Thermoanaerobaculia bacterium]
MSTDENAIRFETDPIVFELQGKGWKDLQEAVLLVPKSLGSPGSAPVKADIQPTTTPHGFRFVAAEPSWEESPDEQDEPNRLRVRVVCSGGTEGAEDEAVLTLTWKDVTARVKLLAGVNRVLALSDILREEYRELRPDLAAQLDAAAPATPGDGDGVEVGHDEERVRRLYDVLHKDPKGLAALCFSGGGIRSATFNLGVLQGLASLGILDKFHYLSTVSGGGYIGSWLSSWIHRSGTGAAADHLAAPRQNPEAPEPAPLRHLRQYSNYLTPKLGVFSADTWTLAAIVIRNLLLNALVILPILAAILTVPLIALARVPRAWKVDADVLFLIAFVCGTLGLFFENLLRASAVPRPGEKAPGWTQAFLRLGLLPLLIGTGFLILAVDRFAPGGTFAFHEVLWRSAVWAIGMPLLAYLAAAALQKPLLGRRQTFLVSDLFALISAGIVITFVYAGILAHWAEPLVNAHLYLYPILGPGLILGPLLLGKTLFMAFSSPAEEYPGRLASEHGDADREWWARWSAWILIPTIVWTLGSALVYFAPFLVGETKARISAYLAAGGLGALTSMLGKSAGTHKDSGKASPWRQLALALAAPLFCLVLLVVLSASTQDLLNRFFKASGQTDRQAATSIDPSDQPMIVAAVAPRAEAAVAGETEKKGTWLTSPAEHPPFLGKTWQVFLAVAALLGFGTIMGYFVNVNRFSLQGMYRNRLVRAYLGASNTRRRPNLFTGFDSHDNVRMHTLRAANRPLHVVNMTLNLVGGKELAWQERKAESFTATPLHCGAASLGYRRSQIYGGQHGISLGTAMATSGAAANPNMGYYSSPPVTFIMTLFNARLGIWLGNPGKLGRLTATRSGPRFSSRVIFAEALGFTDSSHPYVNLSDGGHFENLGLYEMVRRRCRFIVVCDAGGDPDCAFDGLGNAIRKVRIDLGIPIDFDDRIHIYPKAKPGQTPPADARYCAIGTIHYDQVDGAGAPEGTVIYIKPAICGTEPYDVTNYANASATFPHETTVDQWFSETQFESYRALGKSAVVRMGSFAAVSDMATFKQSVEKYIARAQQGTPKVEVILPSILGGLAAAAAPPLAPATPDALKEGNGGTQTQRA